MEQGGQEHAMSKAGLGHQGWDWIIERHCGEGEREAELSAPPRPEHQDEGRSAFEAPSTGRFWYWRWL